MNVHHGLDVQESLLQDTRVTLIRAPLLTKCLNDSNRLAECIGNYQVLDLYVYHLLERNDLLPRTMLEENTVHFLEIEHSLIELRRDEQVAYCWIIWMTICLSGNHFPRTTARLWNTQVLEHNIIARLIKVHIRSVIIFGIALRFFVHFSNVGSRLR